MDRRSDNANRREGAGEGLSLAMRLARLPQADRAVLWRGLGPAGVERLLHDWRFWGRPGQLPPPGDWRVWLVLAGRGFGKTRAGAEWVRMVAGGEGVGMAAGGEGVGMVAGGDDANGALPAALTAGGGKPGQVIPSQECHPRHSAGFSGAGVLAGRGADTKAGGVDFFGAQVTAGRMRGSETREADFPEVEVVAGGAQGPEVQGVRVTCGAASAGPAIGSEGLEHLIISQECHTGHFAGFLNAGIDTAGVVAGAVGSDGPVISDGPVASCGPVASGGPVRIALVGATLAEVRAVMVEGESGLLAISPPWARPVFEPALRRLVWPNGSVAHLYSADAPEQLRGAQHHFAWCDEAAKWRNAETVWANLEMGLRLGPCPRVLVTTTPRPVPLVRRLLADPAVAVTRGATWDNRANLPAAFLDAMATAYGGTRLGRQELEGEVIEAVEGALWSPDLIEQTRVSAAPPPARVVVAVDPPVTGGPDADACGIVVAALGADGHAYVLADRSVQGASPDGWARAAEAAAAEFDADRIVAEANNGGELVGLVLRSAGCLAPVRLVRASRGKSARAEPVAALYEQGRVHHAGSFARLEDELCGLMPGGGYVGPGRSPDRADALVWALTELMLAPAALPRVRAI